MCADIQEVGFESAILFAPFNELVFEETEYSIIFQIYFG
jgi:hypothetical protein